MCGERRRGYLRLVELLAAWMPMCHNCAHRSTTLSPMPRSIEEIRNRLHRDRRADERRGSRSARGDTRARSYPWPRERRGLERRAVGHARGDDLMLLGDEDIMIIEDGGADLEPSEETRIIAKP